MKKRSNTLCVHGGEKEFRFEGAAVTPIFQTATYESRGEKNYSDIRYVRLNNSPNHDVLHAKLCELEGGEAALVTSSGMSAITTLLLTFLKKDDHILTQKELYGGTYSFLEHDAKSLGISADSVDVMDASAWEVYLKPTTKIMYVESIANPLMSVGDLKSVVAFAKKHQLISVIDNTFASPINVNPIGLGFDLVVHSATKYLNGHSDIAAGCIVGKKKFIEKIKPKLDHLGGCLDPHACFLLQRGMKTLALRMKQHNENALEMAHFLESHSKVKHVFYPGLDKVENRFAHECFYGFGGMLAFELEGGISEAEAFVQKVRIPLYAPSLGGVESLITIPALSSHSGLTKEARVNMGIGDSLIRFSVGIEDVEDLIEDFKQALE